MFVKVNRICRDGSVVECHVRNTDIRAVEKATEMRLPRYRADKFILYKNGFVHHIKGVERNTTENTQEDNQ